MSCRTIAFVLLTALLSTSAFAQSVGSAGGGGSGAAGGAPGSTPSGTAGVSSSISNPVVGTPGTPGPSNGAGLPGGPGPGNVTSVPNQPSPPAVTQTVGSTIGSSTALPSSPAPGGGRQSTSGRQSLIPKDNTSSTNNFHPEAVTSDALDAAAADIAGMTMTELRSLVQMFKACTTNDHPLDRVGKCGAVARAHRARYQKARQVDRSLGELERVVRFQNMFRTSVPTTEYEDRINNRLRVAARLALATIELRERNARESGSQPDLTSDVRMAK